MVASNAFPPARSTDAAAPAVSGCPAATTPRDPSRTPLAAITGAIIAAAKRCRQGGLEPARYELRCAIDCRKRLNSGTLTYRQRSAGTANRTKRKAQMSKPLVVVESPAKAKTLSKLLGSDYDVRASVGHVSDLPSKGLNIDVENGFKPTYELTERGKTVVKELKSALKEASELYLATDEDREGEAISWHLLEYLKPKVPVKRMVFHEITKSAIDHAVANPRAIDYGMVDAAETRRILDRLYGYEVSPVLWRRVNRGLSAGRVQSPTVRLIVQRERERIAFVSADYWDIDLVTASDPAFDAKLVAVAGDRIATGKDFNDAGIASDKVAVLSEARARGLADSLGESTFTVSSVEEKPYRSSPKAPFMTSTLQQEGGRKLRLSSSQVMRVAQGLYERGFITYMRTRRRHPLRRGDERDARCPSPRSTDRSTSTPRPSSTRRSRRARKRPTKRSARPPPVPLTRCRVDRAEQPGARVVPG